MSQQPASVPVRSGAALWGPAFVLAAMIAGFAVTFCWLALARHWAFQSHAFDLGNMDQAAWNTVHGHILRFTDMDVGGSVLLSRFAIHVEPLLFPISLLYMIHSGPETLLVVQVLVVSLGAIPAYLVGLWALQRRWLSLVFPAAYLLHPSLQNVLLDDFHAVSLSACFLLWALYFVLRDRLWPFVIFAVLAAATKEEVALLIAALGLVWIARRRPAIGIGTVLTGLTWFVVSLELIVPSANPGGHSPYLARYAYLGHGLGGIILSPLRHPGLVVGTLLQVDRLDYASNLLHPLGFVPLLGLPVLVLSVPGLLINLLSADPTMYSGFYQYSAEIVPYIVVSTAVGIALLDRLARRLRPRAGQHLVAVLCGFVLIASVVDSWRYGFSPLSRGYLIPTAGAHQRVEQSILNLIPADAVVAAADELEPHISDRRWAYLLPTVRPSNGPPARYVILDASVPSTPVTPKILHGLYLHLVRRGYGIEAAQDGVLLLRRGAVQRELPASFFNWIFRPGSDVTPTHARWDSLSLIGFIIHPRAGWVNRSRPAIGVETFWRTSRQLAPDTAITFYLSPVYSGAAPSQDLKQWIAERDSPTWDWLPLSRWPRNRTIAASSLVMLPPADSYGKVDVGIAVTRARSASSRGARDGFVKLGTIAVEP